MTFFFGLAVKEITEALQHGGSLHPVSKAINPLIGTLGGVVGPIAVYFITIAIQNSSGAFGTDVDFATIANGWGIPTATDSKLFFLFFFCWRKVFDFYICSIDLTLFFTRLTLPSTIYLTIQFH